jgi:hypothetical protein
MADVGSDCHNWAALSELDANSTFRGVCTGTAALMLGVWRLLM